MFVILCRDVLLFYCMSYLLLNLYPQLIMQQSAAAHAHTHMRPPPLIAIGAHTYASNPFQVFPKSGGGHVVTRILGNTTTEIPSKDAVENLPSFSLLDFDQHRAAKETTTGLRPRRSFHIFIHPRVTG